MDASSYSDSLVPRKYLYPFVLMTFLFALWGFANDVTNPLVKAFKDIFLLSNAQSSLVQTAFYGGYATMAIPAALLVRWRSYNAGIKVGLFLFAVGNILFVPASLYRDFSLFLVAIYVLSFGLAFIETSAYPCVLSMGPASTATRRLNLAAAFNPIGSLSGMLVCGAVILPFLEVEEFRAREVRENPSYGSLLPSEADARITDALESYRDKRPQEHRELQSHDLSLIKWPYVGLAGAAVLLIVLFSFFRLPSGDAAVRRQSLISTLGGLLSVRYIGGVIAQAFYVGVQIMSWTFIIHYGMTLLGMSASEAQYYNICAMLVYLSCRFLGTACLKFISAHALLTSLAVGGMAFSSGAVFLEGMAGMYSLVAISACMSIMFPTIYGIALKGLNTEEAKLGAAGQTFAIVGGAILPFAQGSVIDLGTVELLGETVDAVRASFLLPFGCFVVIACYGFLITLLAHREPSGTNSFSCQVSQ